jgi:hypothetical protein
MPKQVDTATRVASRGVVVMIFLADAVKFVMMETDEKIAMYLFSLMSYHRIEGQTE